MNYLTSKFVRNFKVDFSRIRAKRESLAGAGKMPPDTLFYRVKWQSANFGKSQFCMGKYMGKIKHRKKSRSIMQSVITRYETT